MGWGHSAGLARYNETPHISRLSFSQAKPAPGVEQTRADRVTAGRGVQRWVSSSGNHNWGGGWGAGCWEMREAPGREAPGPWMAGEGCWGTMRGSECKPCAFISSMGSRSALLLSPLTPALGLIVGINVPFSAWPKSRPS